MRAATPLAVLIAHGRGLPGLPVYTYNPRPGDAYGYYSAVRELLATWREPVTLAAAIVLLAAGVLAVRALLKREYRAWAVVAGAFTLGAIGAVLADRMGSSGAPTIGWPLVWSVPLLPYRRSACP